MPLPCENLFRQLEQAKNDSDNCWDEVDGIQTFLSTAGSVTSVSCAAALSGAKAAIGTCAAGIVVFVGSLVRYNDKLDRCNELDIRAFNAAKTFNVCAGKHADYLNSRLRPKP